MAFYLWKFDDAGLSSRTNEIGERLGMGGGSLRMRIKNFSAINGDEGLDNYARQSKKIYDRHKEAPRDELRKVVEGVLRS